jgi:hypothetical protein
MRSPEDKEGLALLNKWKAQPASIRFSFVGIGNRLEFSGSCSIIEAVEGTLRLEGAGFTLFLNLSDAAFERVGSRENIGAMGLDPSLYPESVQIILGSGDTVNLFVPLPDKESLSN